MRITVSALAGRLPPWALARRAPPNASQEHRPSNWGPTVVAVVRREEITPSKGAECSGAGLLLMKLTRMVLKAASSRLRNARRFDRRLRWNDQMEGNLYWCLTNSGSLPFPRRQPTEKPLNCRALQSISD